MSHNNIVKRSENLYKWNFLKPEFNLPTYPTDFFLHKLQQFYYGQNESICILKTKIEQNKTFGAEVVTTKGFASNHEKRF